MEVGSIEASTTFPVFVSYSKDDASVVRPITNLIRAVGPPAFRDEDSIRPGKKWRLEIFSAIEKCQLMLVFWCEHAKKSQEVEVEYRRAIKLNKDVVPVLLDAAPGGRFGTVSIYRFAGDARSTCVWSSGLLTRRPNGGTTSIDK